MARLSPLAAAALLTAATLVTACGTSKTDRALSGAALGAGGGAALGAATGNTVGGALLGGAAGAATGALTNPDQVDLGDPLWRR